VIKLNLTLRWTVTLLISLAAIAVGTGHASIYQQQEWLLSSSY